MDLPLLDIAIVEDHDALREIMVEVLRTQGHHVQGLDCAEALDDSLINSRIELLSLDLYTYANSTFAVQLARGGFVSK